MYHDLLIYCGLHAENIFLICRLTTRLDLKGMYDSRRLHALDFENKLFKYNRILSFMTRIIHWCCNGVLALYYTIYNFTKFCAKALVSFSIY